MAGTKNNRITLSTLKECECVSVPTLNRKISSPRTQSLLDLEAAQKEISQLKRIMLA